MQELIKEIEAAQIKEVTEFNVGDTIKVHAKIVEGNRERIQVFEGLVIKKQGGSNRATFTVRKQSSGIGVERTWPLYSPSIANIEVVRRGKVRRAKLNYIRNRVGKAAKVKELVKIILCRKHWYAWCIPEYKRSGFSLASFFENIKKDSVMTLREFFVIMKKMFKYQKLD